MSTDCMMSIGYVEIAVNVVIQRSILIIIGLEKLISKLGCTPPKPSAIFESKPMSRFPAVVRLHRAMHQKLSPLLNAVRPELTNASQMAILPRLPGEMAEWLKAHAWNACISETVSRVRIPLSPHLH